MNTKTKNVKMIGGNIPIGFSCPYSEECGEFKHLACCGDGCPVADDKTTVVEFSCGFARAYKICDKG